MIKLGQRTDKELSERIKQVTCSECGGRTDIPKDIDDLKACKCNKMTEATKKEDIDRGNLNMDINHNTEHTKDMEPNSLLFEIALQLKRIADNLDLIKFEGAEVRIIGKVKTDNSP